MQQRNDSDSDDNNYEAMLNDLAKEESEDDSDYSLESDHQSDDTEDEGQDERLFGKRILFPKGYKIDWQ